MLVVGRPSGLPSYSFCYMRTVYTDSWGVLTARPPRSQSLECLSEKGQKMVACQNLKWEETSEPQNNIGQKGLWSSLVWEGAKQCGKAAGKPAG